MTAFQEVQHELSPQVQIQLAHRRVDRRWRSRRRCHRRGLLPLSWEAARAKAGIVYDSAAVEGGWDNLSPEEIAEKLNEKVAEGMINISMNTAPYFEDSTAEGNLMIVNESINNYPQKVQIVRNDTAEQIYESGAIAVGSKIEHAKLDAALPAGTYECTAYFHNLNPETGEIIGTAGAIINISIKN